MFPLAGKFFVSSKLQSAFKISFLWLYGMVRLVISQPAFAGSKIPDQVCDKRVKMICSDSKATPFSLQSGEAPSSTEHQPLTKTFKQTGVVLSLPSHPAKSSELSAILSIQHALDWLAVTQKTSEEIEGFYLKIQDRAHRQVDISLPPQRDHPTYPTGTLNLDVFSFMPQWVAYLQSKHVRIQMRHVAWKKLTDEWVETKQPPMNTQMSGRNGKTVDNPFWQDDAAFPVAFSASAFEKASMETHFQQMLKVVQALEMFMAHALESFDLEQKENLKKWQIWGEPYVFSDPVNVMGWETILQGYLKHLSSRSQKLLSATLPPEIEKFEAALDYLNSSKAKLEALQADLSIEENKRDMLQQNGTQNAQTRSERTGLIASIQSKQREKTTLLLCIKRLSQLKENQAEYLRYHEAYQKMVQNCARSVVAQLFPDGNNDPYGDVRTAASELTPQKALADYEELIAKLNTAKLEILEQAVFVARMKLADEIRECGIEPDDYSDFIWDHF